MSVRLSVPWKKIRFYRKNFHEILCLRTYWKNLPRKFQFTRKLCTFMMIAVLILWQWKIFLTKVVKNIQILILCSFFFRKSCPLWDDAEKYDTPGEATDDSMICHMRIACWVTKVPNKHSGYVTFIAFPLQQWICEHASILRYTYTACLVNILYKRIYFFRLFWRCVNTNVALNHVSRQVGNFFFEACLYRLFKLWHSENAL
jgi:hypothetical protein